MYSLGNNEQSSFKTETWTCFLQTIFAFSQLKSGSLLRLIGSVVVFVFSIIPSETNALYLSKRYFLMFFMYSITIVGMISLISRQATHQYPLKNSPIALLNEKKSKCY